MEMSYFQTESRFTQHTKSYSEKSQTQKPKNDIFFFSFSSEVIINFICMHIYIMLENTCWKITIGIDLIRDRWSNCKHIPVFYAANNVSMINRISVTRYRDAQINRVIPIDQVSALQTNMISIIIRNKKGCFTEKPMVL